MKAIWTGAIGFGLVNIPVKIYSAVKDNRPDFDLLERRTGDRIRYKRVNEKSGKEVAWEDIVKAHLLKEKYIFLEDEDFEQASPEKTKLINLRNFVNQSEIESIYYESPYYLRPQKGGEKAYSLLHKALEKTKKAALSSFVMRNAENLAVIRPYKGLLLLNRLRFQEEIRDVAEADVSLVKISKEEMEMAVQLISRHTGEFDIADFKDEYTQELLKLIRAKAKGRQPASRTIKFPKSKSTDLLQQLKESLG